MARSCQSAPLSRKLEQKSYADSLQSISPCVCFRSFVDLVLHHKKVERLVEDLNIKSMWWDFCASVQFVISPRLVCAGRTVGSLSSGKLDLSPFCEIK
eukprot:48380-Rhodomonas_salina.4